MDVVWAGTFVPGFERNKRLSEYLEHAGISPRVIRVDLWPDDRVGAFAGGRLRVVLLMLLVYPWLLVRLLASRRPDVYLVSYPGWFDVPVVKLAAIIKRRPVVFDVFISLYDTAVTDRRLASERSWAARVAGTVDRISMRWADRILADCRSHAAFLADLSKSDVARFGVVYLGADEGVFRPIASAQDDRLVLFYGNFVPLQGVDVIVRAAAELEERGVRFRMIGDGQTMEMARSLVKDLDVSNIELPGRRPQAELVKEMASAAVCLGIFGETPKADRVIPHKLYEALACGRPVVTADSTAVREVFAEGEVASVPRGDHHALASSIEALLLDDEELWRLADLGRKRFVTDFSLLPQGRRLADELKIATQRG